MAASASEVNSAWLPRMADPVQGAQPGGVAKDAPMLADDYHPAPVAPSAYSWSNSSPVTSPTRRA
jgi:hypothetical protein